MYNSNRSCCEPQIGLTHKFQGHKFNHPMYFDTVPSPHAFKFKPKTDLSESKDSISFEFELPGISKDDIKVQINDDNVLTVTGEKKYYENKIKLVRSERYFGKFSRSFELPREIDNKNIEAKFDNGLLAVTIKKIQPEKPQEKHIEIL